MHIAVKRIYDESSPDDGTRDGLRLPRQSAARSGPATGFKRSPAPFFCRDVEQRADTSRAAYSAYQSPSARRVITR